MANTKSAKKAERRNTRRTVVNKARRTRMRSSWRAVEEAIAAGDAKKAQEALKAAESETMRAVSKKVAPKNTAPARVSRLSKRVAALSGRKSSPERASRAAFRPRQIRMTFSQAKLFGNSEDSRSRARQTLFVVAYFTYKIKALGRLQYSCGY